MRKLKIYILLLIPFFIMTVLLIQQDPTYEQEEYVYVTATKPTCDGDFKIKKKYYKFSY